MSIDTFFILFNQIYLLVIVEHRVSILFSILILLYALSKSKKPQSIFITILSLIIIVFGPGLVTWFSQFGIDSFIEARSFDNNDALFFLKTVPSIMFPDNYKVLFCLIIIWVLFYVLFSIFFILINSYFDYSYINLFSKIIGFTAIILCSIFFYSHFKNFSNVSDPNHLFNKLKENYSIEHLNLSISNKAENNLKTIIYVGESTSLMNMSLYGYFRNNTPLLNELSYQKNFIKFNNLLSTHTHTTATLFKALSLSYTPEIEDDAFYRIKRANIVDVLKHLNVTTTWLSNQNQTGSWNYASNILSKNSNNIIWSNKSNFLLPNGIKYTKKPFDHEFFLKNSKKIGKEKNSLTVLHSIAGHGHYLDYIPQKFHKKIDNFFSNIEHKAIFGSESRNIFFSIQDVEEYDSAIRYIDYSISEIIKKNVINSKDPVIFIYFSDHGESVYTDLAHDSSRLIHEMFRVPFFIYFNDSALKIYNDKFKKISSIANSNQILTSNNISKLISYLYNVQIKTNNTIIDFDDWNINTNEKIIIRDTNKGKKFVSLDENKIFHEELNENILNDQSTNLYIKSINNKLNKKYYCYHRSNSIAKVLRASIAGNCIEIDVVLEGEEIYVYHPSSNNYGLTLKQIFDTLAKKDISLWIDAKNINIPDKCFTLLNFLKKYTFENKKHFFVEFPPLTKIKNKKIIECMDGLNQLNFEISYYIQSNYDLTKLNDDLEVNKYIKNLSFDYVLYDSLKNSTILNNNNLDINTWFYKDIRGGDFKYMILNSNKDPNTN